MPSFQKIRVLAWLGAALLLAATACRRSEPSPRRIAPDKPITDASRIQTVTGRVVAVADGDTVTVLDGTNTQHRIRLQGIDAPESRQAFGTQSKKNLSEMIFGRDVTVTYEKTDQYGRVVGKIVLDGRDINLEQVRAGLAWHYKDYQREQTPVDRELYTKAEDEARIGRRGLWSDGNPVPPSQFRKDRRTESRSRRDRRGAFGLLTRQRDLIAYSY